MAIDLCFAPHFNTLTRYEVDNVNIVALADFPPDRFRILCACSECDRTSWLDRSIVPESMSIKELRERATCKVCGSRNCGVRIVCAGSGEYRYG